MATQDTESLTEAIEDETTEVEEPEPEIPIEEQVSTYCIQCHAALPNATACLTHMKETHQLDVQNYIIQHSEVFLFLSSSNARPSSLPLSELDFYGCFRLVNFLRQNTQTSLGILQTLSPENFEDDKYLIPVIQDDSLLSYGTGRVMILEKKPSMIFISH